MKFDINNLDKTYIIAEMSANHAGSMERAKEIIHKAKEAGADCVKIQTYTPDTLTIDCHNEYFNIKNGTWEGENLYSLYGKAYTPWEWHEEIFRVAKEEGLVCFSTPFDKTAVDFLEGLDNPIYKIASFEITDIPLIKYIAQRHKPIILSTGIAMEEDIKLALDTIYAESNKDVTLLKCTSAYPAPIENANLLTIPDMKARFGVKVGLSDHTEGSIVPIAAVALGAEVVEKHFIIDRSIGGPDSAFSMEAKEFKQMVDDIRNVEKALGEVSYPTDAKTIIGRGGCRSLYVAEDMKAGDVITEQNVRSVRPGYGLHPKYLPELIGKKVNRNLEKGERFILNYLS
jgi:pseudaminic acid synthase